MPDQDSPLGKAGAVDTANTTAGSAAAASLTAAKTPPPASDKSDAAGPVEKNAPLVVNISLVWGGMTNVEAPVAVGARYDGLAFAGSTKPFDQALDSWLTRAADLGIIGSALGQLFPIDLRRFHMEDRLKARTLLLAGMGEPGRFAQDSLQFIMSNIIVAIKAMGETKFAIPLLGIRRKELAIGQAVRGFIQGIDDGYERFKAIAENATLLKPGLLALAHQPLSIVLVHPDEERLKQIERELERIAKPRSQSKSNLQLTVSRGKDVEADPKTESASAETEPDSAVTYLRITQSKSAAAGAAMDLFPTDIFQFSALSDISAVPQREQKVNSYLLSEIASRLIKSDPRGQRERQGYFFTNLVIPDDFAKLIEGPANVTLEVDETTAAYPWEMAGCRKIAGALSFVGTNVAVSRQFRTLLSPPPTSPPPLNSTLNVLIIADPAFGHELPGARKEAEAVVEVLQQAQDAWGDQYKVTATVRVSSCGDPDKVLLQKLSDKKKFSIVQSADCCDPVELATLLVNDQYDVVHYAGHGVCDPSGQTGWVFAPNCILSAKEIFRVRQVPRLVFANACFSAATADQQRKNMATMAQAFFGRGIPNYIGAGWEVDDTCAVECSRWFYARLLGLAGPNPGDGFATSQAEANIGTALRDARNATLEIDPTSSSWGAYQHYGHVGDRLVPVGNPDAVSKSTATVTVTTVAIMSTTIEVSDAPLISPAGPQKGQAMADQGVATTTFDPDDSNLVFVNGINFTTGTYAFTPRSIDDLAKQVRRRPGDRGFGEAHGEKPRSFALPAGVSEKIEKAGWAIVFPAGAPEAVRSALKPLIEHRRTQAGKLVKVLDYNGEQVRDWLAKQGVSPGNMKVAKLPYYVLLVGSPEQIPFEFQYLLGVEYAVGRLSFDDATDYARYVSSTIAYESGASVPNAKQISYWGTRHSGDRATKLSASFLIDPLANGIPSDDGPVNTDVGYSQTIFLGKEATKANLVATLHAARSPALLFTASHGMAFDLGDEQQGASQGALLCQDWPGFGDMKVEHFLSAKDVADDANVNGMVAFLFACYGAGTPDKDQFVSDLSEAGTAPPPAAKPFIAALPQRLLAHPKGGALAVIGHIDRAWSFSMQAANVSDPQIGTFRNSLVSILSGTPVGHAMSERFGSRYGELSTLLLNLISPTATGRPPSDDVLVSAWIERNDSQNYVLLGDPAVRIRHELLA